MIRAKTAEAAAAATAGDRATSIRAAAAAQAAEISPEYSLKVFDYGKLFKMNGGMQARMGAVLRAADYASHRNIYEIYPQ